MLSLPALSELMEDVEAQVQQQKLWVRKCRKSYEIMSSRGILCGNLYGILGRLWIGLDGYTSAGGVHEEAPHFKHPAYCLTTK